MHALTFERLSDRLDGVRLAAGTFGRIPGTGEVHVGYQQRLTDAQNGLDSAAEGVSGIGASLESVGTAYEAGDQQSAEGFQSIGGDR